MSVMPHKILHKPEELAKLPADVRALYDGLSLKISAKQMTIDHARETIKDATAFIHAAEMRLAEMYHTKTNGLIMITTKVVVTLSLGDGVPQTEAQVVQALREAADRIENRGLRKTPTITDTYGKVLGTVECE